MAEKRFTIADYPTDIIDNQSGKKYPCSSYGTHMEIICDLLNELSDENEQLKNKIDVLEDDNETYHKSLEILNLYTKRFIPTKCTNEFKDCKTNRYYWLDHEGNFKGCLELLNLLDCENEVLKSKNRGLQSELQIFKEDVTHSNLQINKLADENEELKHHNELLSDELEQCKAVINKKWSEYLQKKELME